MFGRIPASATGEDGMLGEALDQVRERLVELEATRPETLASRAWVRLQAEKPAVIEEARYPEGALDMPWWAPGDLIAEAVRRVQKRSKVNVGDPDDLALAVRRQIDRAMAVAALLGCTMEQLAFSGVLAVGAGEIGGYSTATTTRIEITSYYIRVHRASLGPEMDGHLTLRLPAAP